ncbi:MULTISPECIES: hypothetical protein [unclassified Rhizobacter]|nr:MULTISPECIES: hypothetical protein [unclassified Rhizobacter]
MLPEAIAESRESRLICWNVSAIKSDVFVSEQEIFAAQLPIKSVHGDL